MLTPIDIQSKVFKSGGMGYNKQDVDAFFSTIAADYETLYKDNLSLKEKIKQLDENLNHYKEIEKSMQKALMLAETTAEETILSARKNATVIEQEAILKAQSIVADSKIELEKVKVQFSEILRQYDSYRAQYKALAQAQLELLDSKAFDLESSAAASMELLEKSANEHADELQTVPVHNDPIPEAAADHKEEVDDELDETLSTDKTLIKEFTDIFDENV
jgi:cell division initiation protein